MKRTLTTALTFAAAGALFLQVPRTQAQDDAPPPPPAAEAGGAPGQGGPGGDRMAQFRERMNERVKTQLKATDEEWAIIQPLLDKVETKQRETMTARFGGPGGAFGGGRGNRGGGNNGGGNNAGGQGGAQGGGQPRADRAGGPGGQGGPGGGRTSPEAQALQDVLQADGSNPGDIKAKLAALREQRKKAAAELTQAREDLKKVLNLRQEATMVMMGILE